MRTAGVDDVSKGYVNDGVNKRFYFITIRDNEGNARKYIYNVFRSLVKKYNAKYYGVLAEKPFPHVHAIVITDEYIDYGEVWRKLIPSGCHFDAEPLDDKDVTDLKRIIRYIELHVNKNDGFLYTLVISTFRLLSPNLKNLRTFHGHPASCRIANRIRRCWT